MRAARRTASRYARQPAQARATCATPPARSATKTGCCAPAISTSANAPASASAAACGWTSRACRSSTRRSSRFRSATSASRASCFRRIGTSSAAARRSSVRGTGTSRRTTMRRSCRRGSPSAARRLDTEFRYLTDFGRGKLDPSTCPTTASSATRAALRFADRSDFTRHAAARHRCRERQRQRLVRGFRPRTRRHQRHLPERSASLTYLTQHWLAVLRAQNFQTIDDTGIRARATSVHAAAAARRARGLPDQLAGLDSAWTWSSATSRTTTRTACHRLAHRCRARDPLAAARRRRLPRAGRELALHGVSTRRHAARRRRRFADRAAPILSVDGGLIFERPSGSRGQRLQTLEPRFMYLYVPYRNQDDLPVFDTAPPT